MKNSKTRAKINKRSLIFIIISIMFFSVYFIAQESKTGIVLIKEETELGEVLAVPPDIKIVVSNAIVDVTNGKRQVTIKSGDIKINNKEYNVKAGGKFIFDKNGKLKDGTEFSAGKTGVFRLKGLDWRLPEFSGVQFFQGSVIIRLSDSSKLEEPKLIDKEEAKDSKFEIRSWKDSEKGGIAFLNGDRTNLESIFYETDKNGNSGFYFNQRDARIGELKIDNSKEEKIGLFFDGNSHKESKGDYISINRDEGRIIIGQNGKSPGPKIKIEANGNIFRNIKETQHLVFQAGKEKTESSDASSGRIEITGARDNNKGQIYAPKIETFGDFKMENGKGIFYTDILDGEKSLIVESIKGSKDLSYAMELIPKDENENYLTTAKDKDRNVINSKLIFGVDNSYIKVDANAESPLLSAVSVFSDYPNANIVKFGSDIIETPEAYQELFRDQEDKEGIGELYNPDKHKLVVAKFGADWCPPCRELDGEITREGGLAQNNPNVKFVRINVDNYPNYKETYGIGGIPHVVYFKDRKLIGSSVGSSGVQSKINEFLGK